MTSERSGVYRILRLTAVYDLVQKIFGSEASVRRFVTEYIKPFDGASILDIGSGTGIVTTHLGNVKYLGIEPNPTYVDDFNQKNHGTGSQMVAGTTDSISVPHDSFDIVLISAVLHHVDDEIARSILSYAANAAKVGGRVVLLDPVLHKHQNPIARFLVSRDRGKFVRREEDYRDLFQSLRVKTDFEIRKDLSRLPYSHIITTFTKAA
jgi:SAM-dependent methyltransferase